VALATGGALAPPRFATFHGRDLFAPAAILLARGADPGALGVEIDDPVRLEWPRADVRGREVRGTTLAADPFGNVVTSIRASDLGPGAVERVEAGGKEARWVRTFAEGRPGELLALVGSGGRVELAVREASAAALLGRARGTEVRAVLVGPAGGAC
jgi:S-adenosylmethionine hydrolase